jgi:hypothetical protein
MLQCHTIVMPIADELPGMWRGFTPHVIWHFTAGFGAYCDIVFLCCCRMEELDIPYQIHYVFGIIPTISTKEDGVSSPSQKKLS